MKVYVDNSAVFVSEGMTVRHALLAAGRLEKEKMFIIRDEWGNEVGLDGALHEGRKLFVIPKNLESLK